MLKLDKKQLDKTEKQYLQSVGIVTASYEIAVLVAKNKKPHTIAEELIMPAAKVLVKHVIGDKAVSKLNCVSVSNNTIQLRITEMSTDIEEQVITEVQGSKDGSITQLVESTDVSNYAQLLVYMRYTTKDAIRSELLLINEMRTTTIAAKRKAKKYTDKYDCSILVPVMALTAVKNNLKLNEFFWMMTFLGHTRQVKVRRRCSLTRSESALFTACPRICRPFDSLLSAIYSSAGVLAEQADYFRHGRNTGGNISLYFSQ